MIPARPGLKAALRTGGVGAFWFAMGSPALVEVALSGEPDAVVIDLQHGLWDRVGLERVIGEVAPHAHAIARLADGSDVSIAAALDAGAEAVLVPLVESAGQAAAAVAAAHYPPRGRRSGGGVRPLSRGFVDYVAQAHERTCVGVMIETERGVDNAESIIATPSLDFVFIGTGDLALSLGCFPAVDARHEAACRRILGLARAAGVPCGIFTGTAEAAVRRRQEGYALVVVANDIDLAATGFRAAGSAYRAAGPRPEPTRRLAMPDAASATPVQGLAAALLDGSVKVIDLSQTLKPSTPVIGLPPPMAQSSPFSMELISKYDDRGPAWYWNNISMGEHTGTHFDAPAHWVTGKDVANGTTDTLSPQRFVAPAVVIDVSKEVASNEDFLLEPQHIEAWEAEHGRIPDGAWVLLRTDWSKRTEPAAFLNGREDGPHSPGPSAATMRFLAEQRNINGWGVESVGTDAGQAFGFDPPFPAHNLMHGSGKLGLASLTNLDQLPPTGAILITAPLKIENGSGSPLRVLALVGA